MARLLFANSQRGRSSNIYETFLGEYMKMFCRLTKFAFSTRAHLPPPHLSNINTILSLSFEERTHIGKKDRKDHRCCYPSNRLLSSYPPLYDWGKKRFFFFTRPMKRAFLITSSNPLVISNPNWIAHRRHMSAPFFLQTTAHQFKRQRRRVSTPFSRFCVDVN